MTGDLTLMGSSPFDAIRREDEHGEHWTGRDLQPMMRYSRWEDFASVIRKARASLALVQGDDQADHHFGESRSDGGRWGNQQIDDYRLTRFGAYLIAMAGDHSNTAVAEARIYFAVKARQAETTGAVPDISTPTGVLAMAEQFTATARQLVAAEAKLVEQAPMVAAEEHHRNARGLKAVGDFANDLKVWARANHPGVQVKHQFVWDHLARLDMVIRGNTVRHNQPTAKAVDNGWCVPKVSDFDTSEGSRSSTTTRLTPKGEGYAWDRITAYVEANGTLELPRQIGEAS